MLCGMGVLEYCVGNDYKVWNIYIIFNSEGPPRRLITFNVSTWEHISPTTGIYIYCGQCEC